MTSRYDRAITIFSTDGHLFQVEYAQEAVKKGSTAVGVRGTDSVVIAVEKKSVPMLQDDRTIRKIHRLDEHVILAFAGLSADARVLVDMARIECQSHKLTVEDACSVGYVTKFIANTKQRYTQSTGRRPFGISMLIGGFDPDGTPRLYQTEPSGAYYEWMANSTGRGSKPVREYLEEKYKPELVTTKEATLKLAVRALTEVAQSGAANIEVAVISRRLSNITQKYECDFSTLTTEEVEQLLKVVEEEKAAEAAEKKK